MRRASRTILGAWARGLVAGFVLVVAVIALPATGWAEKTGVQEFAGNEPPSVIDAGPCPTPDEESALQVLGTAWDGAYHAAVKAWDKWAAAAAALRIAKNDLADSDKALSQAGAAFYANRTAATTAAFDAAAAAYRVASNHELEAASNETDASNAMEKAKDNLRWAISNYRKLGDKLHKKKCPEPATTPPPAHQPTPPAEPTPPPKVPAPVSPTVRTTSCAACEPLANQLNSMSAAYAAARNSGDPAQAHFLSEMRRLSGELDACERTCKVAAMPPATAATAPAPEPKHPDRSLNGCGSSALEVAVVDEINRARADPPGYASRLGGWPFASETGDAVAFLKRQASLPPLACDGRLASAAAAHAADQGPLGQISHTGSDGSRALQRMQKAGVFASIYAEEISMGRSSAAGVVSQLILDIPGPQHPHRADLFDAMLKDAGVGCGPNKTYHTMCVIDLTGEQAVVSAPSFDCAGVFYDAAGRLATPPPSPHSRSSEEALKAWIGSVRSFYAGASSQPSGPRLDSGKAALCTDRRIELEIRADDSIAKALTALQKLGAQVPEDAGGAQRQP